MPYKDPFAPEHMLAEEESEQEKSLLKLAFELDKLKEVLQFFTASLALALSASEIFKTPDQPPVELKLIFPDALPEAIYLCEASFKRVKTLNIAAPLKVA